MSFSTSAHVVPDRAKTYAAPASEPRSESSGAPTTASVVDCATAYPKYDVGAAALADSLPVSVQVSPDLEKT